MRYLLPFLLFLIFPIQLVAQDPISEWQAYTSMRNINQVLVHPSGIWSATTGGVLRFDPVRRTYQRFTSLEGVAGNNVLTAVADDQGHLWFGTAGRGLSRFRPEDNAFDPPNLDFVDLPIQALATTGNRLFVGTDEGVSVFLMEKEEVKETYRQLGSLTKDTGVDALAVFNNQLFVGTEEGIAWADLALPNLQDPDSWFVLNIGEVKDLMVFNDSLYAIAATSVFVYNPETERFNRDLVRPDLVSLGTKDGQVIVAQREGTFLARQGESSWTELNSSFNVNINSISRGDSTLWVGSVIGLRAVGSEEPPNARDPAFNEFYDMRRFGEDTLWVASVEKDVGVIRGLYQFDGTGWNVFTSRNGLPSDTAVSLEIGPQNRLWVGTWGQGLAIRQSNTSWLRVNHNNSILQGIPGASSFVVISDITRDANGLMWLANIQVGLVVMDGWQPRNSQLIPQASLGLAVGRDMGKIAIGPDNLKWVSTPRDGFLLFDDGGTPFDTSDDFAQVFSTLSTNGELSSDRTRDIAVDQNGTVWVTADNGLNAVRGTYTRGVGFDVSSWRIYSTSDGLPDNEINAVLTDPNGTTWVGTENGLSRINQDGEVEFTFNRSNSGLIDNRVKSLLLDEQQSELWVGTINGLSRLNLAQGTAAGTDLKVYPNPFVLDFRVPTLTFANLPLGAALRIFALGGQLVRQIDGQPGRGTLTWNGQNDVGYLVGSGIYFFIAEDETGTRVEGKFALVNQR